MAVATKVSATFLLGSLVSSPRMGHASSNSTLTLSTLGAIGGGTTFVLVVAATIVTLVILLCRRVAKSRAERTQTRRPCTEALEQSLSLECSHSSDVQEGINRSLTAQTSSHKLLPPQPGSNTETRMQVPTSTREEHLQSTGPVVHSGPGRKRPGGYEWMLPARATLPRTLTSSQGGTGNHKASRSVENLVSEKSNYSRQPIPTFSVTTTKANPSLNDDSEEDYEEMRSAKRRSAYSPRHQ